MRSFKHLIFTAALLLGLVAAVSAGNTDKAKSAESPKELKNQTHCPVMGGKIDSTAYTDIQGQRIYHCCPMCTEKLTANPDKYFEEAAEKGIVFENVQAVCPVSGMELKNKDISTYYKGRHLAFCSDKHMAAFMENPGKHLEEMDKGNAKKSEQKKDGMKDMSHGDHGGHGDHGDHGGH